MTNLQKLHDPNYDKSIYDSCQGLKIICHTKYKSHRNKGTTKSSFTLSRN